MKMIKNNFIMISYVARFCPFYVLSASLYILAESFINIRGVLLIDEVITLVEQESTTFGMVLNRLIIYMIIVALCSLVQIFHNQYITPRYRHVWVKKIQRVMFEKSAQLDISCFDDPKVYDQFSKSLKEGDLKGIDTFDTFVYLLRNALVVVTIGTFIVLKDAILLIIVLAQSIINFILTGKVDHLYYVQSKETEPHWRRYSYIKRIFYLERYACEIKTTRLNELLIENQLQVKDDLDVIITRDSNKIFKYNITEDIFYQFVRNFFGYVYLIGRVYGVIGKTKIPIATFSSTVAAVQRITNYLYGVIYYFTSLRENANYIDDFLWLMKYKPIVEGKGGDKAPESIPQISISNLSFKYPSQDEYVLKNVNLSINPKEKIAIIGYNGAGKTTLIKLLLKFYEVEAGQILMDNNDYNKLDEKEIRNKFVSVFQNFQIYSTTVLENVLFRKRINEEDDKLVWDALEKADLGEKIRTLPKGLDTILTKEFDNEGLVLSGGEKQKLAIARIFASTSPIIILDEPTSSLDPVSEYEVNKKILNLCTEKTIVLISHRLSTVVDASIIYMFDRGEIIEQGTHQELMKKKGKYFEMFTTQAKLYTDISI